MWERARSRGATARRRRRGLAATAVLGGLSIAGAGVLVPIGPADAPSPSPPPVTAPGAAPLPGSPEPISTTQRLGQEFVRRMADLAPLWDADMRVSVAVQARDGRVLGVAEDDLFVSASAAKAYWAAAVADLAGPAAVAPYADLLFRWSDNDAAGALIDVVGPDAINRWLRQDAGLRHTALIGWYFGGARTAAAHPGPLDGDNYTTTGDAVRFLNGLAEGRLLGADATEAVAGWMRRTPRSRADASTWGGVLPDRLPGPVQHATWHKGGWLPPGAGPTTVLFDMGLFPVGDEHVVLAMAADHPADFGRAAEWMSFVACSVYAEAVPVLRDCAGRD